MFGLWYVAERGLININRVVDIFTHHCAHDGLKISREEFLKNLELKKANPYFQFDMSVLLPPELNWDFEEAYQYIIEKIISKFP